MKLWFSIFAFGLVLFILTGYLLIRTGKLSVQGSIRWNNESVITVCPHCDWGFHIGPNHGH